MNTPEIEIGILSTQSDIRFHLNGKYKINNSGETFEGDAIAHLKRNGQLQVTVGEKQRIEASSLVFEPLQEESAYFDMEDVIIGIDFHWERKENQRFKGKLKFLIAEEKLIVINILSIEDYLLSVISSEMSATSSVELLKAHAVISRSWVLAQKEKSLRLQETSSPYQSITETEDSYLRWYDREDHDHFDVCADDHCQRYQGIARSTTSEVVLAVIQTAGEVLTYDGKLCDARFSKCCGGISENFEKVWEPIEHPYLKKIVDNDRQDEAMALDLKDEATACQWIQSSPTAFCNTKDPKALSQILNDYDRETTDFYRWEVLYSKEELSRLIAKKTGWDFGEIIDLIPVERGESGRLVRLKIVGTKKTMTIGKELFIRKALAESHLYSSAFRVEKTDTGFILKGAGWGHGVGLCQIGAAMMGERGYTYREILSHYFMHATLQKRY